MPSISYRFSHEAIGSLPALIEFVSHFQNRFSSEGTLLNFRKGNKPNSSRIVKEEECINIEYDRPCDAFRALCFVLSHDSLPESGVLEQKCAFESLGVMLDVSRNGVFRPESLKSLFRTFALMGINSVQLYMEDVYVIPGEPFFGYARGGYTQDELRQIDAWGAELGIEVIPCIQTLGHLEQIHQWSAYKAIVDVPGVLLVGDEKTYALIGKMLDTLSACFRSRTIHIGMDEAHGIGQGRYRQLHGVQRPFDILNQHLVKVSALCKERGLNPMMWGDMYFRIGSETNDYYDEKSVIPPEVASAISADVDLVYWDYYHIIPAFYENLIDRHRSLGKEPIFAAGVSSWGRLWTCIPAAIDTISAGMKAAKNKRLSKAFVTVWGDDGAEHHPHSALAAIQYFAETAYSDEPDSEMLERLYSISAGGTYSGCLQASEVDIIPCIKGVPDSAPNFGKWLLWHDPILGFLDRLVLPDLPAHYDELSARLERISAESDPNGYLKFPALLARCASLKAQLLLETKRSYREKDGERIQALASEIIPKAILAIADLREEHQAVWYQWYKPFGWEVIERRYAGVISRLESLQKLLFRFVKDPSIQIPEFEYETLNPFPEKTNSELYFTYARCATSSTWT